MTLPYNPKDENSILAYAKMLIGKSLRASCGESIEQHIYEGKGKFGQLLEKYYFGYDPNSKSQADFFEIGADLKSSPLKLLQNNEYRSKERLVLSTINYSKIVEQTFDESELWKKNAKMILIFYLYEAGLNVLDYIIKLVDIWDFPSTDLEIIKQDWEFIKKKVAAGKAHELSESDTFYLGACTKGANANTVSKQPFSEVLAKKRAFSLKQSYVNHIIASIAGETTEIYGKLITTTAEVKKKTIEEIVIEKFQPYYGLDIDEIIAKFDIKFNQQAKSFLANLTKAILGIELNKEIEEFNKAGIIVKTVRIKKNNLPKESVSFKSFAFIDIVNENWEDSEFKEIIDSKFLFVFFQFEGEKLILRQAKFWNMPYADTLEAKKVWAETKEILAAGTIVREIKGKIRYNNFPKKTSNPIVHVRPHGSNAADCHPLPVKDKLTNATEYTKQCFWFNNTYVRDEIYLK